MAAKKSATSMKLESVLDLNQASALKKELVAASGKNIVIDASGVERVGVQCIQVLVAASRAWEEDTRSFTFSAISDAFSRTLNLVGVNIDHLIAKESH